MITDFTARSTLSSEPNKQVPPQTKHEQAVQSLPSLPTSTTWDNVMGPGISLTPCPTVWVLMAAARLEFQKPESSRTTRHPLFMAKITSEI